MMPPTIFILNGPNLNLLGMRQPEIYGHETLAEIETACRRIAAELNVAVEFRQSNAEHELVDWIQEARTAAAGIVINPAGFTTTSVSIVDALAMCTGPIVEVHLSNIHRREAFRTPSLVSTVASAVICGCGAQGYELALQRVARAIRK